jgi:hypothetical protein
MKNYKVIAKYTVYLQSDIEAENEDQAWKIAYDLDGAAFDPFSDDNWTIADVFEVTE